MTDSTTQIETEIEAHRAAAEQTLDRLKDRLSFDQVVDDLGHFLGMDNAHELVRVAGQKIRERPIALGLIGAGLLWLAMGSDDEPAYRYSRQHLQDRSKGPMHRRKRDHSDTREEDGREGGRVGQAASAIADRAQDVAVRFKSAARDATSMVRDASDPVAEELNNHPLLFGAGAVVAGALIGSALPMTDREERLLAPRSKALMSEARTMSRELGDQAARVAKATYGTALKSARREGLVPDEDTTLSEKIERVAEETMAEVKSQLSSDTSSAPQDIDRGSSTPRPVTRI